MDINGGRLSFDAYIKDSDFQKQIAAMEQKIVGLSSTTDKQAKKMDETFSRLAKSAAAFLTISQAQNFVQQLIKVRSEFQQLEIAFTTMLGSKEKADQLTKDLIEFASTTPFGMSDAANAAKQLLAYGSAAETVTDELRMLGDVAAGTSQPIGDLVYLYGTLRTQGRAYTQDIRQFAGRGIPIYKELATVLGVAEDQVNNLVTSGRVGFAEIEKAFRNMTAEGSMFGGLMEAQSKTIQGELERLGDAVEQMFNDIGKESEGIIGNTIQGISALVENYRTVLDVLAGLILTYGAYRVAVLATVAVQNLATASTTGWTAATMLQYRGLLLAETAQKLLNRTMLANPYVAVTTAVAGLAFVLYKFSNNLSAVESAQKRVNDLTDQANSSVVEQTVKLNDLIRVAQNENKSKKEREKAIIAINKISPEYLGNINLETIGTKEATSAVNDYINALKRKAFEEAAFNERVAIERERMNIAANGTGNAVQRAGMWLYSITGGDKKAMEDAAKKEAIALLDAREEALDEELRKRSETSAVIDSTEIKTITQRLSELNTEIAKTEAGLKAALSPGAEYDKSNIESLQDSLKNLKEERDLLMGKSKEGDKALKEIEQWGEKKIDILKRITDQENDLRISMLSQDEQELERVRTFYNELRRVVEEHNKKAPKGQQVGSGTLTLIDNMEAQELGYLTSGQQVKKDLENIQKLERAADQLIALNRKINQLEDKKFTAGFSLSPSEEYELREYQELRKKLQEQEYKEAYDLAKTHADRLAEIESEYQNRIKVLGSAATNGQLKELQKHRDEAIKTANETEAEKLSIVFKGIQAQMVITIGALKHQKSAIEEILGDISLPEGLKQRLEADLSRINGAIQQGVKVTVAANFKQRQQELLDELKRLEEAGLKNTQVWEEVYNELVLLSQEASEYAKSGLKNLLTMIQRLAGELSELGSSLSNLGDAFGNRTLSGFGDVLSGIASNIGNISIAFDEGASNSDKYAAAIQSLIGMISMVANAAAERKRAEEEYYRSVIQLQNDYNLSLIERQRLEAELGEGVFLTDYVGRMKGALEAGKLATDQYRDAMQKLIATGRGKDGQKNVANWSNIGKGAGYGATAGAVIGSVIPVIGTAIGAAVGAIVGGLVGLFGGKKKKDTYSSLINQYPELKEYIDADSPQDLADVRNLAEQLIKNQAVDKATQQQLENIIELIDEIEAARQQIREVVQDLAGDMGADLRNSLVSAFKAGENAALAMGKTVSKVLENMLSELLFNKAFEQIFTDFEDDLTDAIHAYSMTGDESHIIEAMGDFLDKAGPAGEQFYKWVEMAKQQAAARDIDIFSDPDGGSKQGEFSKGIQGITENTAGRVEGELGGLRLAQLELLSVAKIEAGQMDQQLSLMNESMTILSAIRQNTGRTASNTDRLVNIEAAIVSMNNKISNGDAIRRGGGI